MDTYDNFDRVIQSDRRDTSLLGKLVARTQTHFDDRGRVYRVTTSEVDPATGTIEGHRDQDRFHDAAGNLIRQEPAGSMDFILYQYDSLGRQTQQSNPLGLNQASIELRMF